MTVQSEYLNSELELFARGISQEALETEVVFKRGDGTYLYDMDGKKYLDFSSGIFTNSVGQCHPYVVSQLKEQLDTLWNIHDFSSSNRLKLLKMLDKITPSTIESFCFMSTGAEAVELALRAVLTYVNDENIKILTFKKGYHGKTAGPRLLLNWRYRSEPYKEVTQVEFATCYRCPFGREKGKCNYECAMNVKKKLMEDESIRIMLFEPILGAGGIHVPPKEFWNIIQEVCKDKGIIMIADEIFTSGGRIGNFLACDYFNIKPDMLLMAKGLASGFPFSVLGARKEIINNKYFCNPGDTSSTFASHPFGIQAAVATLQVIEMEQLIQNVHKQSKYMKFVMDELKEKYEVVGDTRGIGIIYALEFVTDKVTKTPNYDAATRFFKECFTRGLKTCLGGNIVRISPPMNAKESELIKSFNIMNEVLKNT